MAIATQRDEQYRSYALTGNPMGVLLNSCMPLALFQALQSVFKILDSLMASHIGSDAVSAVAALSQITLMITALGTGLAVGGSIKISEAYGRGDYEAVRTRVAAVYAMAVSVSVIVAAVQLYFCLLGLDVLVGMVGFFLVSQTLPWLAEVFARSKNSLDPAFRDMIVSIHRWEMVGYVTLGINSATIALLLGYGYTKLTMLLNVARVFLYRVPVLWAFQQFTSLGPEAVGMTMMISNVCTGLTAIAVAIPVLAQIRRMAKEEACAPDDQNQA